eukprot:7767458-Prorocentrum_lima.AAC.1
MTSSLVGSEMCIRDSAMTVRPTRPSGRRPGLTFSFLLTSFIIARRSPCSVSYTHLTLPTICSV